MGTIHPIRAKLKMAALAIASSAALQACDGDQPYDELERGDTLVITPKFINLALLSSQTVPDSGLQAQRIITVYAKSNRNVPSVKQTESVHTGRPAEGAHVEIVLGETCPTGTGSNPSCSNAGSGAGGQQCSSIEDYTNYVKLNALDENTHCRKNSDASLHCVLTSDGTASFKIDAVGEPFYGEIPLRACSGAVTPGKANILLGNVLPPNAVLEIADVEVPFDPIDCNDTNPKCDQGRSANVDIRIVTNGEKSIPVLGSPVGIELSIHRAKANGAKKGTAWLTQGACDPPQPFNHIHVTSDASSGVGSAIMCADGHEGDYELSAIANGSFLPDRSLVTATGTIRVTPQPTRPQWHSGCGDGEDGVVAVRLVDCDGALNSKYFLTSKDNPEEMITNSAGFVCLDPVFTSTDTFGLPACKEPLKLEQKQ